MPNDMSTKAIIGENEFIYQFEAKKDMQLEKVYAKDFLTPSISKC